MRNHFRSPRYYYWWLTGESGLSFKTIFSEDGVVGRLMTAAPINATYVTLEDAIGFSVDDRIWVYNQGPFVIQSVNTLTGRVDLDGSLTSAVSRRTGVGKWHAVQGDVYYVQLPQKSYVNLMFNIICGYSYPGELHYETSQSFYVGPKVSSWYSSNAYSWNAGGTFDKDQDSYLIGHITGGSNYSWDIEFEPETSRVKIQPRNNPRYYFPGIHSMMVFST